MWNQFNINSQLPIGAGRQASITLYVNNSENRLQPQDNVSPNTPSNKNSYVDMRYTFPDSVRTKIAKVKLLTLKKYKLCVDGLSSCQKVNFLL